jgi:aminoglycoside 3-N-acetyltransferase
VQQRLVEQLRAIGIQAGDTLMIHASLRKVGHVEGGADGLIDALRGSVGSSGTLFAYADFEATPAMPHFDAARSPCATDHGVFPEVLRLRAGTLRSLNPGASVLALGAKAGTLTHPHPLKYGYGVGTPFARFVASGGKVLLLGSPFDTVSLLHYAEDIANLPSKRVLRYTVPVQVDGSIRDVEIEEFDTSHPVVTGMPENYFEQVVQAFVVSRELQPRLIGAAASYLIDAQPLVQEAKERMEREYGN